MKKFFGRLGLFLAVPLIINLILVLITPLNFVTFRSWETLAPQHGEWFPGFFYPNQRIEMVETGDLGHHSPYAVQKEVIFITDAYGYRYSHDPDVYFPIVLYGDSALTGSGLTQSEIPVEVLADKLQTPIYSVAPNGFWNYFSDSRFIESPPEVAVLVAVERGLQPGRICNPNRQTDKAPLSSLLVEHPSLSQAVVWLDVYLRNPVYLVNYMRSRQMSHTYLVGDTGMVFQRSTLTSPSLETIDAVVEEAVACSAWMEEQGTHFIILPIPEKTNIDFEQVPEDMRSISMEERRIFMQTLISRLAEAGVDVIDTQTAFEQARNEGMELYLLDDTHWNADGIALAMDLLAEAIDSAP